MDLWKVPSIRKYQKNMYIVDGIDLSTYPMSRIFFWHGSFHFDEKVKKIAFIMWKCKAKTRNNELSKIYLKNGYIDPRMLLLKWFFNLWRQVELYTSVHNKIHGRWFTRVTEMERRYHVELLWMTN